MSIPSRITYRTNAGVIIPVERMPVSSMNEYNAAAILRLLGAAYQEGLEVKTDTVSAGTVHKEFNTDDTKLLVAQAKKMHESVKYGSHYLIIRNAARHSMFPVTGLMKVTPSRATALQKLYLQDPNAYIDELAIDPAKRHEGRALAMVYSALRYGFSKDRIVATDIFDQDLDTRTWFINRGLAVGQALDPYVFKNGQEVPQTRYTSADQSIGNIMADMESSHPWLMHGEISAE